MQKGIQMLTQEKLERQLGEEYGILNFLHVRISRKYSVERGGGSGNHSLSKHKVDKGGGYLMRETQQ